MKILRLIITLTISIILLSGCGFHLRNAKFFPPELKKIYLEAENPYGPFEITFKKSLRASGIKLVDNPLQAPLILHISSNYSYAVTSSGSSTQARVYTLYYTATFSILDQKRKTLLGPNTVSVSKNLSLAPNEIFEVSTQTVTAKQDMENELSIKILNILGSAHSFEVFSY